MKRMYYLTDTLDSTEQISTDMHQAGITNWNFHVLSKDEAGLYKRHIQSANYFQRLDIVRYSERGGMFGFAAALLVAAYIMVDKPFGSELDWLAYLAILGFITLFGIWVGGLIGIAHENHMIARFHDDIEAGRYLILIDIKADKAENVKEIMAKRHPEAKLMSIGSTLINPFKLIRSSA